MEVFYLFVAVQFILFILYKYCLTAIENFQYVEMIYGAIFIILIFGYIGENFVTIPNLLEKSIYLATFYSVWFYITKFLTNAFMKDSNGVIHWT
jgi:hypothetical protein